MKKTGLNKKLALGKESLRLLSNPRLAAQGSAFSLEVAAAMWDGSSCGSRTVNSVD
jgi:hypothetical protein